MTPPVLPSSRAPASLRVIWQALKTWYDDWFNLFIQNFLVTVSWLTIVLGPPMLFGLYEIGYELAHGRSNGPSELFRAARRHFWVSWQWTLINLLVAIIVLVNIGFYWQLGRSWSIVLVSIFLFLGLFWAMMQVYVIPFYMVQTHRSLVLAHKNAALTFLASPGYTLMLFLYAVIVLGVSYGTILLLILGLPTLTIITNSYAVKERLQAFGVQQDDS